MVLTRNMLSEIPIPQLPPRTITVRTDRNGPGAQGFGRNSDCGCLMTLLCRNLGIVYNAQGGPGAWGADALRAVLVWEYGVDPKHLWSLVQTVQTRQDSAWNGLVAAAMAKREPTEYELTVAKELMGEALAALRRLNVVVDWREGIDLPGANSAGEPYPDHKWLTGTCPIEDFQTVE